MVDYRFPVRDARKLLSLDMGGVPYRTALLGLLLRTGGGYTHDSCHLLHLRSIW